MCISTRIGIFLKGCLFTSASKKRAVWWETIITGRQAGILPKGEGLEIVLYDGTRQQLFPDKPPSILCFKNYTVRLIQREM